MHCLRSAQLEFSIKHLFDFFEVVNRPQMTRYFKLCVLNYSSFGTEMQSHYNVSLDQHVAL